MCVTCVHDLLGLLYGGYDWLFGAGLQLRGEILHKMAQIVTLSARVWPKVVATLSPCPKIKGMGVCLLQVTQLGCCD